MSRISLIALCFVINTGLISGQDEYLSPDSSPIILECPKGYITPGTGINNNNGILGINFEYGILPQISLSGGFGLSSWGGKASFEGKYYFSECYRKLAVGIGVTRNSGIKGIILEDNWAPPNTPKEVELDLLPQTNIALQGYRYFKVGKKHRFHLSLGYSFETTRKKYQLISLHQPSKTFASSMLFSAPGGLIFGLGFSFGISE